MKIVISKCYGGFGLSEEAYMAYAKRKGITLYPARDDGPLGITTYWTVPPDERVKECENWHEMTLEERRAYNEAQGKQILYDRNIGRNDPDLVAVVEELGQKASGQFAKLHVVEIPDDVQWEVSEYDGFESIEEVHRSWS
jgi:hypothetical protein